MDYIYIIGLLSLAFVIVALVFIVYSILKKRQSIILTASWFSSEMEQRISDIDGLILVMKEQGEALDVVSSSLQQNMEALAVKIPTSKVLDVEVSDFHINSNGVDVDPRALSVSGELKQEHFGAASYLQSVDSTISYLSKKTSEYLRDIYTSVVSLDKDVRSELKTTVSLQQEIAQYISAIQSNANSDSSQSINPQDKKLISSLSQAGKELVLLQANQVEVQLIITALLDALSGSLSEEYLRAG